MQCQMQVQQGGWRARTDRGALLRQCLVPSGIGAGARRAADGGILVGDLAVQDDLSGGVIADVFVSQERDQALLEGAKAAFDFAFGLRTGGDEMGYAQGGEGALELRTGIAVIGHGIVAKEAEPIGVHDQRQVVLEKEPAEMLEMIPRRIGRNKDRAQKFSGMIVDGQEQGLLGGGRPPLVDGGVVLPEFAEAGALPAAAGFGARLRLADEVGKVCSDKSGDGLTMALETEADFQFIGYELKVRRFLQRDKIFEELARGRWPIWPVAATGEPDAELGAVLEPAGAESIKVCAADLEVVGGFHAVDLPVVKLLEEVLEKGVGQAFGQLFFSQFRMNRARPLVEGLRRPPLRSGLLNPSTKGPTPGKTLVSF